MVPEASLTRRALFSGTPSPSLLLQGEWRPLSHPPILPCPHSTPWRIFQQPPSCLPCVVVLMTSPRYGEGETRRRICVPAGEAERGRLGSQGPSPQSWAHTHTETQGCFSAQSLPPDTDPPRQIHMGMGSTDCSGRGHTPVRHLQFVYRIQITNKLQNTNPKPARLGTELKLILLTRRTSPNLPSSDQASNVNRL